jgi:hypothetical protein
MIDGALSSFQGHPERALGLLARTVGKRAPEIDQIAGVRPTARVSAFGHVAMASEDSLGQAIRDAAREVIEAVAAMAALDREAIIRR